MPKKFFLPALCKVLVGVLDRSGSSLVESMIAMMIFAGAALAVFPILVTSKTFSRGTDVRELCTQTVKAKLAQYMAGGFLSSTMESDYGTLGVGRGVSTWRYGGFNYAKMRYNQLYRSGVCDGQSKAAILSSASAELKSLGIRECIGTSSVAVTKPTGAVCKDLSTGAYTSNCASAAVSATPAFVDSNTVEVSWNDPFNATVCTSQADRKVRSQLPFFRLYVKLERVSPWSLDASALSAMQADGDFRYHPSCPNSWSGPYAGKATDFAIYDFDGLGDSIKVTVTGVIDISSVTSAQLSSIAGISANDPARLMCSVSSVVKQDESPIRYALLGSDMISSKGKGLSAADRVEERKVLSSSGVDLEGYHAVAVHPLNLSVYLLGADRLDRLSECGGIPLDCHIGSSVQKMLDDDGSNDTVSDPSAAGGIQSYGESGLGNIYRSVFFDQREGGGAGGLLGKRGYL